MQSTVKIILFFFLFCVSANFFSAKETKADEPKKTVLNGSDLDQFEKSFLTILLETGNLNEFFESYPVYVSMSVYIRTYRTELQSPQKEARDIIREKVNELLQSANGQTISGFLDKFSEKEPQMVRTVRDLVQKMKDREKDADPDQLAQAVASIKKSLRTTLRTLNGETVINASSARNLFNSLFRVIASFDQEKDFFLAAAFCESFMPELLADQDGKKEGTQKVVNFYNYFFEGCTGPEFLQKITAMDSFKEICQSLTSEYKNADEKKRAQIKERMQFYKSKVQETDSKNKETVNKAAQ